MLTGHRTTVAVTDLHARQFVSSISSAAKAYHYKDPIKEGTFQ
jgi:hypothetical protein